MTEARSVVKSHQGKLLMLAAKQYPNLQAALLEIIQNAIDGRAKHIGVRLDRKKRSINVFDDGKGASIAKFNASLGRVGDSEKTEDELGQFGLGLVSPIDKCEKMTFTSCPVTGENGYVEWVFIGDDIISQKDEIVIPRTELTNYQFGKESKTLTVKSEKLSIVSWRTKVTLHRYSDDRVISKISSIDDLVSAIFTRYGVAMHKRGTRLTVEYITDDGKSEVRKNLKAPEYAGEPLPRYMGLTDGYRTFFNLYLAKADMRGKAKGIVSVGVQGNDFRFPFKLLASKVRGYLSVDVITALNSGVFEGEILSTSASLHENREQFVVNQGLVVFANALEEWYQDVGAANFSRVGESREDERYQQLGLESMKHIESMLKAQQFEHLAKMFKESQQGTIGKQHGKTTAESPVATQEHTAVSTQGSGSGQDKARWPTQPKSETDQKEPQTKDDHHPYTVAGPRGQNRTVVKGGSFGLQFVHSSMQGDQRLWFFDGSAGILYFNVRHSMWALCESSDKRLMQLQELVAVQAIQWFFCPDHLKDAMLSHVDDTIATQVFLLLHSTSFNTGAAKKLSEE